MMNPRRSSRRSVTRRPNRRGSVLVVVLALLSALMLLGFLFYTIASQERENARYFTASEKWYAAQLDADALFDFALEQVIVGPQDDYANSALWGGRYSLLGSLVGDDMQPYSGAGVSLMEPTGVPGAPHVDANNDGTIDAADGATGSGSGGQRFLRLNLADYVAPLGAGPVNLRNGALLAAGFPEPDVGYTYPDLNSPFLAYVGTEPVSGERVAIPSFHRPQYLRGLFTGPSPPAGAVPATDWYTNAGTLPYVMRPHAAKHVYSFDYDTGQVVDTGLARYTDATVVRHGTFNEGFWTWDGTTSPGTAGFHAFDVDADGDDVKEAVLLDLDHPVEETPDGSQQFLPLFGITIYDLDGLLNLNAHGNIYGPSEELTAFPTGTATDPFEFLSKSNEGRQRHEVNPQWALDADNGESAAHSDFFGHAPGSATELANMEWWFILAGRPDFGSSGQITQPHAGRWGEWDTVYEPAVLAGQTGASDYPLPGLSVLDNGQPTERPYDEAPGVADANRGLGFYDETGLIFSPNVFTPPPRHPVDVRGQGTYVSELDGKTPIMVAMRPGGASSRIPALQYNRYWLPLRNDAAAYLPPAVFGPAGFGTFLGPLWQWAENTYTLTFNIVVPDPIGTAFGVRYPADKRFINDPGETILDPNDARDQVTDSVFRPDETAFLHLDDSTRTANSIISRLVELAPANFRDSDDALARQARRSRFTTVSHDLKAYSMSPERMRPWETRSDLATSAVANELLAANEFPPVFGPMGGTLVDPFRPEARGLLQQIERTLVNQNQPTNPLAYDQNTLKRLLRKLSVNHVAASTEGTRPRFYLRPLTPHPPAGALDATAIGTPQVTNDQGVVLLVGPDPTTQRPAFGFTDRFLKRSGIATQQIVTPPPAPWSQPRIQEWHARRDRQNMARDVYTLLYTLNARAAATPTDNPVTGPPGSPVPSYYTTQQLVDMAQFAVNLVDAMDTDDAVTCFVFDLNLADTNGYTPFDDGYSYPVTTLEDPDPAFDSDGDGDATNDLTHYLNLTPVLSDPEGDRGMVFGVEAHQLAFSEAMAVLAKKFNPGDADPDDPGEDYAATDWDDSYHRDFAYVELQNITPGTVNFNGGWSIVCQPVFTNATPRAVTLRDNALTVNPAGMFTIGSAGDGHNTQRGTPATSRPPWDPLAKPPMRPSHVAVDVAAGENGDPPAFTDYELIAPLPRDADPNTTDLYFDLITREVNQPNTFWVNGLDLTNGVTADAALVEYDTTSVPNISQGPKGGSWLDLGTQEDRENITAGAGNVRFVLRRRLNLHRTAPTPTFGSPPTAPPPADQADNPWVVVDEITVPLSVFDLNDTSTPTEVQTKLQDVKAHDRAELLVDLDVVVPFNGTTFRANHLNFPRPGGAFGTMTYWQRHFDRPFASVADILNVPLYGPERLTQRLPTWVTIGAATDPPQVVPATGNRYQVAASKILFPEFPGIAGPPAELPQTPNFWYRLLEFVEVPHKYGDLDSLPWFAHYAGPSPWVFNPNSAQSEHLPLREFGRINLNTLRHEQVLAGLLDDPRVFGRSPERLGSVFKAGFNTNNEGWGVAFDFDGGPTSVNGQPIERRDWWVSLLYSRDGGFDPYSSSVLTQSVILPGIPSANPFRGFAAANFGQTLLRTMPLDEAPGGPPERSRRSLFQLGNDFNQVNPPGPPATPVPFTVLGSVGRDSTGGNLEANEWGTRYRLLGKVLNHGTTRSNTYIAFMTCDFYEAAGRDHDMDPDTPDVFQIGARLSVDGEDPADPEPRYRGVFVLDRTAAIELLERRDLPPTQQQLKYPQTNVYSTYSFAREQGPDGRPTPTFPWRDLILYRKITKAQ